MIEPGSTLGVLGGGQLGAMFADAARRLGYRVAVWDPDADAPALRHADLAFTAPFTDADARARFADSVQAATYEWENVPSDLCESLEARVPVRPGSRVLRTLQNRLAQKTYFAERGFPVTPFKPAHDASQLETAAVEIGFPSVCKTATAGYDGKGQWRLSSAADLVAVSKARQAGPSWVVEQFLAFEKEISVLVARTQGGDVRAYPVAENVHENGILRTTRVPADVSPTIADRAETLARTLVEALDGIGVFCVEMFLMPDGGLFVNEVAPRPHNSGHYTLDACTVSQFEQQLRTLCGLPLGEVRLLTPAAMVNVIGEDLSLISGGSRLRELLAQPGVCVHVYGKRPIRPGRKMGHVTFLAEKPEAASYNASAFRALLKGLASS